MTLLNQAAFAAHIGVQKSYVTQLKKAGRLVMAGDKVDVEASIRLIDDTKDPGHAVVAARHQQARELKNAPPVPPAVEVATEQPIIGIDLDMPGQSPSDYQRSKAMREHYNALAAKADYEERIKTLLNTEEARAAVADGDTVIRNRLESLPDILAPQLAAETDEQKIRALLIDYIESLLGDLSRSFYQLAK